MVVYLTIMHDRASETFWLCFLRTLRVQSSRFRQLFEALIILGTFFAQLQLKQS